MPIAFVRPRVEFLSAVEFGPFPIRTVRVTFTERMWTGVVPALASFEVIHQGNPFTPTIAAWSSPDTLELTYAGAPGAGIGTVNQLVFDPNCRSFLGELSWAPQSIPFNFT